MLSTCIDKHCDCILIVHVIFQVYSYWYVYEGCSKIHGQGMVDLGPYTVNGWVVIIHLETKEIIL